MAGMEIPTVETARLLLTAPDPDDFDDAFAMWSNPDVTRFIGKPSSREEVWARILRYVGHWQVLGYGFWVAREKASGRYVGEVGMGDFHRDIQPPLGDFKEAGWTLAPWAQGKGYATEAMGGALRWADRTFGPERIVCIINPENAPSVRVAERCGFREYTRGTYRGDTTLMLERLPPG
jgi:RimJ/RimL family protein N-acetyltransferase